MGQVSKARKNAFFLALLTWLIFMKKRRLPLWRDLVAQFALDQVEQRFPGKKTAKFFEKKLKGAFVIRGSEAGVGGCDDGFTQAPGGGGGGRRFLLIYREGAPADAVRSQGVSQGIVIDQ